MDINTLRSQTEKFFLDQNFDVVEKAHSQVFDLLLRKKEIEWAIALLADQASGLDYLKAFEKGLQALISDKQHVSNTKEKRLALALAFDSTREGLTRSYRRALNKYSNSIIFEDLRIHLLLIQDNRDIEQYAPDQVNQFLRDLNSLIARKKSRF
jgi:hypothetical protein